MQPTAKETEGENVQKGFNKDSKDVRRRHVDSVTVYASDEK